MLGSTFVAKKSEKHDDLKRRGLPHESPSNEMWMWRIIEVVGIERNRIRSCGEEGAFCTHSVEGKFHH
jgi:hypothetical protein